MLKRQRDEETANLDKFVRTYGAFAFIFREFTQNNDKLDTKKLSYGSLDRARLQDPAKFPYQQPYRLYRIATDAAKKCLEEVSRIMQYVPESYKLDIMTDRSFYEFNLQTLNAMKLRQRKQQFDQTAFTYYAQMLLNGLEGFKETMPEQFRNIAMRQIHPFIETMTAISSFSKAIDPESKMPQFYIPFGLIDVPQRQA